MDEPIRIFVLGAGRMGSIVAKDLRQRNDVEVGVGDIDRDRAEAIAKQKEGDRAFVVDVTDTEKLSHILSGYDAVVNASWYEYNLLVMRACLKAKCSYNDLGGLFHMTQQQLRLDEEARSQGIAGIVGGGESPGITNVMCRLAAEEMSSVDYAKILVGAREIPETKGVTFPFSVSTVIDEYTKNPVEYINGKFVEVSPLSGDEEVIFPDPVGKNVCHYSIHSEPATIPSSLGRGIKNVEFKLGISEKMVRMLTPLIETGMTAEEPKVQINGASISPKQFLVSFFNSRSGNGESSERTVALRTVVGGTINGEKMIATCELISGPNESWGITNATAYLTGVAGSIFGQLLADGKVKTGVAPPELAVEPNIFVAELGKRGIKIKKSVFHDTTGK
ncbi:MAG: saccharopine dehydrogenase NADP-binding domain-containing protein [Thaumarchaeota archaeon]|nr:saccharopine dehydrogenase NADP-binding domain-containing protein [Nitrososphaerota archaeon]